MAKTTSMICLAFQIILEAVEVATIQLMLLTGQRTNGIHLMIAHAKKQAQTELSLILLTTCSIEEEVKSI